MQLFIGGLQFFIGGLQFFPGGARLLAQSLNFVAILLQFSGMSRHCGTVCTTPSAGGRWHWRIAKHNHYHVTQHAGSGQRLHRDIDKLHTAGRGQLQTSQLDGFAVGGRVLQGSAQRSTQTFADHGVKVPVGLAGRGLKILAGAAADIDDVAGVVDHHCRRGVHLQQHVIGGGLQIVVDVGSN